MKGVGLRALGDPTGADRADMFARATIARQGFQSGEINGRDSFSFPLPYSPFTFIKAIPVGGSYRRAGDDDDRRDPHELQALRGHRRRRVPAASAPSLRFPLDKRLYDDFERGDRDTYSVPIDGARARAGLSVGDISRVQIEKSPDGVARRLAAARREARRQRPRRSTRATASSAGSRTTHRTWRAPDFRRAVAGRRRRCRSRSTCGTRTRSSTAATTTATSTATTTAGASSLAYVPGTVVRDRATGGSFLSGRIGDGDKASITYTIETLTPTAATPTPPVRGRAADRARGADAAAAATARPSPTS